MIKLTFTAEDIEQLHYECFHHPLSIPITLVLDNARYQKCAVVTEVAQALNIELLYLTAYSPNLNLIERLWKFVKKQCLYSIYYADLHAFTLLWTVFLKPLILRSRRERKIKGFRKTVQSVAFKEAIADCLNQCHTTYKPELDSLLTLRFQSFKNIKPVP